MKKLNTQYSFIKVEDLPKPDNNRIGFPWTEGSIPPQDFSGILPKISIITPSFNQGEYIEETIRSILLQGYSNLEYIIIDGGSSDNSVDIIKKYEKWLTYWVSESDEGQSDAINKGLKKATGEIFNWINSDDLLALNALLTIGLFFSKNPQTDALIGKICFLYNSNNNRVSEYWRMKLDYSSIEKTMLFGSISQQSLFYRLEKVQQLGGVKKSLQYCMDIELWHRFLVNYGANTTHLHEECFAFFRYHEAAKSRLSDKVYREWLRINISLLNSINFDAHKIELLKLPHSANNYSYQWLFQQSIDKKQLVAYIFERMLTFLYYYYPIRVSLKIWSVSFLQKPLGRSIYFYTLPLRELYRKTKKKLEKRSGQHNRIFTRIFKDNDWQSEESVSGIGSTLTLTNNIRLEIPKILTTYNIQTLLDAPCGDFNWMRTIDLSNINYIGADIVKELIVANNRQYARTTEQGSRTFIYLNLLEDTLPDAELLICRDCLVHFAYKDIWIFFNNLINQNINYLLTTTYPQHDNTDILTGEWRPLNLQAKPFCFPEPILLINEGSTENGGRLKDKSLGLWDISALKNLVKNKAASNTIVTI